MYGTYTCGRCGGAVTKSTRTCPHCKACLSGIRCRSCGFVGGERDFPSDRCPKCGSVVRVSRSSRTPAPSEKPREDTCRKCGKKIPENDLTCPHCGYTQWGVITGMFLFSAACFIGGYLSFRGIDSGFLRYLLGWGGFITGTIFLAGSAYEAGKGIQAEKNYEK